MATLFLLSLVSFLFYLYYSKLRGAPFSAGFSCEFVLRKYLQIVVKTMEETVIFPSPNWFQPSGLVASTDGWLFYGGPSKSLCALEPLPQGSMGVMEGNQTFKAHVLNRAHPDK